MRVRQGPPNRHHRAGGEPSVKSQVSGDGGGNGVCRRRGMLSCGQEGAPSLWGVKDGHRPKLDSCRFTRFSSSPQRVSSL